MGSVLNSWKEISSYLRAGLRTVQRWEKDLALPVYRTSTSKRGPVFAYTSELDTWVHRHCNSASADAHYQTETTRQAVMRLRGLRAQMRELMRGQKLIVSKLHRTTKAGRRPERS